MPKLHVIIPMDSDGPKTWDLPQYHLEDMSSSENYLTRIDWMLGQVLVPAELY